MRAACFEDGLELDIFVLLVVGQVNSPFADDLLTLLTSVAGLYLTIALRLMV